MKQHEVTVPQIGLIAGTRAMLGAGIALLLSEKLSCEQRRAIRWTLVAVGALTTISLALQLLSNNKSSRPDPLRKCQTLPRVREGQQPENPASRRKAFRRACR